MEADAGRLPIGALNTQLIGAGASVPEYAAAMKAAVEHGYFTMHTSGGYVTFHPGRRGSVRLNAAVCSGGRQLPLVVDIPPAVLPEQTQS